MKMPSDFECMHGYCCLTMDTCTHNRFMAVFRYYPGELVPEEIFCTNLLDFMVQGELSEAAGKSTIRLGATPSGLNSNPPPSSRHFYAGCPSCRNPPNLSWLEQAPNMLDCIPSGSDTKWLAYPVAWLFWTVVMQGIIRPRMCPFSRESVSRWWKVEDQWVLILRQLAETNGTEGTREVKYVASQTACILLKILWLPFIVNLTVRDSVGELWGPLRNLKELVAVSKGMRAVNFTETNLPLHSWSTGYQRLICNGYKQLLLLLYCKAEILSDVHWVT